MDLLVAFLIEWLALNTDVKLNNFPRIEVVRHSDMLEMSGVNAQGLYHWEEKKIYISNRVDLTTIKGISIVLHELVHHHQNVSGLLTTYECKNQSELMAYDLQRQFLTSMKSSLTLELDPMHVTMASTCFNKGHVIENNRESEQ